MFISSFFEIDNMVDINLKNTRLTSYLSKYTKRIQLPTTMFETKRVYHVDPPRNVAYGIQYSPIQFEIDLVNFDENIFTNKNNIENVNFRIKIFNHDGVSDSFLNADYFSINILGCYLIEKNIGDFSHRSNEIQKLNLIYQPSYITYSHSPKSIF